MTGEATLITYLNESGTVPAFGDVPEDRPRRFLTVERTGGARSRIVDEGTYAVQAWAESRAEAMVLADRIAELLDEAPAHVDAIAAVEVVSVYNFPDPDSGTPRYQLTVTAVVMPAVD